MTLEQLEGCALPSSGFQSGLTRAIARVLKTPLGQLSVEDLRVAIGQKVGLQFLLPLALEVLEREPLAEGDFYPGDLLLAVARSVDCSFWRTNAERREQLSSLAARALALSGETRTPADFERILRDALGLR